MSLHSAGTMLLLKPTGETYTPNCTTNGIMNRKSLYLTFNDANHRPAPMAGPSAIIVKSGSVSTRQPGTKRYQIINTARSASEIRKSTKLTITALDGIASLGK